ncbi:MAG: DUF5652 family protein [Patescibacteria group bacterium]|nr:DUF5652 family protein [Patescibacteria group bacterium]
MELLIQNSLWFLAFMIFWVLPWKAYALWTAAKKGHKRWFIALILLNTFAILDIFYIFYIAKKNFKDIKKLFTSKI